MADFVIIDTDIAMFMPTFGAATVVVQPGKIAGSGTSTISGKKICIDGDEKSVSVPGCMYMTPQYSLPGVGTLKIDSLAPDQVATKSNCSNKPMVLKGGNFNAKFEVQAPAKDPTPMATGGAPIPDATPSYKGFGNFITTNMKVKAT
jgi:hypothetical protein